MSKKILIRLSERINTPKILFYMFIILWVLQSIARLLKEWTYLSE